MKAWGWTHLGREPHPLVGDLHALLACAEHHLDEDELEGEAENEDLCTKGVGVRVKVVRAEWCGVLRGRRELSIQAANETLAYEAVTSGKCV